MGSPSAAAAAAIGSAPPSPSTRSLLKQQFAPPCFQHSLVPFGCLCLWLCSASCTCLQLAAQLLQQFNTDKAVLLVAIFSWALYLFFLAYHSLWWTPLWQQSAPHHMVAAYGAILPLLIWLMEDTLPIGRGYPCIEVVIIVGFQVRLQLLPFRGVLGLSLLFLTITITNFVWSCLPLGWTFTQAAIQFCPAIIINYILGLGFSCLVALARNRQNTSAAASHTAHREGCNFMSFKFLLLAERWLLAVVPAASAEAALASLSAVYVSLFFVGSCINFSSRGTLPESPTMDMLVILLAMYWGSSDTQHQKNLVVAQARAYYTVRSLLHNVVPAHIAKRMEDLRAHEAMCDTDLHDLDTRSSVDQQYLDQQHQQQHQQQQQQQRPRGKSLPFRCASATGAGLAKSAGLQSTPQLSAFVQHQPHTNAHTTARSSGGATLQRSASHDLNTLHSPTPLRGSLLPSALRALKESAEAIAHHVGNSRSSSPQLQFQQQVEREQQQREEEDEKDELGCNYIKEEDEAPRVSLELPSPQKPDPSDQQTSAHASGQGSEQGQHHELQGALEKGGSEGFVGEFTFRNGTCFRQQHQQHHEYLHHSMPNARELEDTEEVNEQLLFCHSDPVGNAQFDSQEMLSETRLGRDLCSEQHDCVTVCFSDVVGFTSLSEQLRPVQVMALLSNLYAQYDAVAKSLDLYTVDTVGDCYMCAANLIQPLPNHAEVMVTFAKRILDIATHTLTPLGQPLVTRVGIHTGSLMSGILGESRMKFTLVGDTCNTASRMESTALPNTIQISSTTYEHLRRGKGVSSGGLGGSIEGGGGAHGVGELGVSRESSGRCEGCAEGGSESLLGVVADPQLMYAGPASLGSTEPHPPKSTLSSARSPDAKGQRQLQGVALQGEAWGGGAHSRDMGVVWGAAEGTPKGGGVEFKGEGWGVADSREMGLVWGSGGGSQPSSVTQSSRSAWSSRVGNTGSNTGPSTGSMQHGMSRTGSRVARSNGAHSSNDAARACVCDKGAWCAKCGQVEDQDGGEWSFLARGCSEGGEGLTPERAVACCGEDAVGVGAGGVEVGAAGGATNSGQPAHGLLVSPSQMQRMLLRRQRLGVKRSSDTLLIPSRGVWAQHKAAPRSGLGAGLGPGKGMGAGAAGAGGASSEASGSCWVPGSGPSSVHTGDRATATQGASSAQSTQREHTQGDACTSSHAVPSAQASGAGCSVPNRDNWLARDVMVKGKGRMRVYWLAAAPQSAGALVHHTSAD